MLQVSRTDPRAFASQRSHPRFVDRLTIETPGLSGHGAPVDGAIAHNGEGDPCELIGDRYRDKLEWFGFHKLRRPHSQPIPMGLSMEEDGMAPTTNSFRRYRFPIFDTRPRRSLPPEEFCLGANPRNAANSRGPEKTPTSCTLAAIAEAVTGPIPGTLIRRRAFASVFTSSMKARSLTAISSLSACSSRIIGARSEER